MIHQTSVSSTIFDDIISSTDGVIWVNSTTIVSKIEVKKCIFSNITGRAIYFFVVKSSCSITHVCCFHVKSDSLSYSHIFCDANSIEYSISSAFDCLSRDYFSILGSNEQIQKDVNITSCTTKERYFFMIHNVKSLSSSMTNFFGNTCSDIFGVSSPGNKGLRVESSRCNMLSNKLCSNSLELFHVNIPNGSLTVKEFNIFKNQHKYARASIGQLYLDSCWADDIEIKNDAQIQGVVFTFHATYEIEGWNIPGCHFHSARLGISDSCCRLINYKITMTLLCSCSLNGKSISLKCISKFLY